MPLQLVIALTVWLMPCLSSSLALTRVLSTTGAPQKCDSVRLNRIENSFVPNVPQTDASAGNGSSVQGKHQPLQWKHRQRPEVDRVSTISQHSAMEIAFR